MTVMVDEDVVRLDVVMQVSGIVQEDNCQGVRLHRAEIWT